MALKIFHSLEAIKKYRDNRSGNLINIYDGNSESSYYISWLNSSVWKIHQGILLINGFPPDMLQFISNLSDLKKYSGLTEYFITNVTAYDILEIVRYVEQDLELGTFPLAKPNSELVNFRDFISWAYDKNIRLPEIFNRYVMDTSIDDVEHEMDEYPFTDDRHEFYAPELALAYKIWSEIYRDPEAIDKRKGHIGQIVEWIKNNYPDLSANARKRIATVINIEGRKDGGSLSKEPEAG